LKFEVGKTLLF